MPFPSDFSPPVSLPFTNTFSQNSVPNVSMHSLTHDHRLTLCTHSLTNKQRNLLTRIDSPISSFSFFVLPFTAPGLRRGGVPPPRAPRHDRVPQGLMRSGGRELQYGRCASPSPLSVGVHVCILTPSFRRSLCLFICSRTCPSACPCTSEKI